jgi:hypothetical protein
MAPSERLSVVAGQLTYSDAASSISRHDTAGILPMATPAAEQQKVYAVALPEKLTPKGPWHVYRHVINCDA